MAFINKLSGVLLDAQKILQAVNHAPITLEIHESLPSTNDYLKTGGDAGGIKICLAEQQTQGKGRLSRNWHSPFGQNIYLSLSYPFTKSAIELSGLSLMVGLCVCRCLNTLLNFPEPAQVKWPNDVMYGGAKIAGALIEIHTDKFGGSYVIIGVGINVNMTADSEEKISQTWTSIKKITQQEQDRNLICAHLINDLLRDLRQFSVQGFSPFVEDWRRNDYLYHKPVTLVCGDRLFAGIARGVNHQGQLILETEDGRQALFNSGDTSLRTA